MPMKPRLWSMNMSRLSEMKLATRRTEGPVAQTEVTELLGRARSMQARCVRGYLGDIATALGLQALASAFKRAMMYRQTVAELRMLDDRALQDIGLTRVDLAASAVACCESAAPVKEFWGTKLVALLKHWAVERETMRQLSSLDDRMLRDIGFERKDLREVSRQIAKNGVVAQLIAPVARAAREVERMLVEPLCLAMVGWGWTGRKVAANQDLAASAKAA